MSSLDKVRKLHPEPDKAHIAKQPGEKFKGFDFLRAIFVVVVVALKSNLFLITEAVISSTLAYILMAKVGYLAVPIFLQISLFLLYIKLNKVGSLYFFKKRLPKLIYLYIFWVGLKVLFDVANGNIGALKANLSSARSSIEFIVSGGNSPFFFFFSLIFLSTLATALFILLKRVPRSSLRRFINYFLLSISCILVFSLSVVEIFVEQLSGHPATGLLSAISNFTFWDYNPIAFLPYIFTTAIITQEVNEEKLREWSASLKLKIYFLLALYILFFILEWHLFENMLHYSRLSLVFGSWLLLYFGILCKHQPSNLVKFLSACSLGIYGFHVFFTQTFSANKVNLFEVVLKSVPVSEIIASFLIALIGSIGLTLLFRRIRWLKNFV